MSLLDAIVRNKQDEIARRKRDVSVKALRQNMDSCTRIFMSALNAPGLSVIAEIKYRSPSAGILPDQRDPVVRGLSYAAAGARALSVLTDTRFFGGSREHLTLVRRNIDLPLLRKDFILDEYQIYESRALGADAVLLIVRLLDDVGLSRLMNLAREMEMICLVEAHTADEIAQAVRAGAQCIGINNRDLDTLEVDIQRCLRLRGRVPGHCATVAESGIATRDDFRRIEEAGFDGVLIGQALAQSPCASWIGSTGGMP